MKYVAALWAIFFIFAGLYFASGAMWPTTGPLDSIDQIMEDINPRSAWIEKYGDGFMVEIKSARGTHQFIQVDRIVWPEGVCE